MSFMLEVSTTDPTARLLGPVTERIASRTTVSRVRIWRRVDGDGSLRLVADVGDGPALDDELARLAAAELDRWMRSFDPNGLLTAPLTFEGRALGVLTVVSRGEAGPEDRSWLRVVADGAAATIAAVEALARSEAVRTELEDVNASLRAELRDAFEEAPIPYVHEALDTRFIRANRAALRLLGIEPDDVATTFGRSLVADTPESRRRVTNALEGIAGRSETGHAVLELRRKDDGRAIWVEWWSQPAPGGAYTRTMMTDITDRIVAEQTKNALQLSMESGQVGDWDLDLAHDTSRRSFRHDQCFGYDAPIPEQDWGRARLLSHVHEADRERVAQGMDAAAAGGADWASEFRVLWANGEIHWLEARGRVYRTSDGKADRMLGVVLDITARMASAEALRDTKLAMDFALEAAHIGDWDLDVMRDTSRRSLRHDQCFGFTEPVPESEWGVERFRRCVHPEDRDRVFGTMQAAITDETDWAAEFRVVWDDASIHWLEARGRVYSASEGKATRMLGIVMDITARKHADATLRAAEQSLATAVVEERSRMARDIHDTLAQGFTGVIIQLEAAEDATSRGLASEADSHVRRAGRLARESLHEARRSVRALRPQALEDNPVTAAIVVLVRTMTEGTGVQSHVAIRGVPRELPPEWDTNLLRIGQEVATNALRHARARRFDVEMSFVPDEVRLDFRDDGDGFDVTAAHDGFGLIGVGERVERMGGTVSIASEAGKGTSIAIALPLPSEAAVLA